MRRPVGPVTATIDALLTHLQAMVTLLETGHRTGQQPWARIHDEDGDHWRAVTEHLREREATYLTALLAS